MIRFLRGTILSKSENYLTLEVNNIGYKINVSSALIFDLKIGEEAALWTHHHIREDAMDLYGFRSEEELSMFELLLSVSGIGPKSALGVLAIATPAEIRESVAQGDGELLSKVSGIGKKTAERIVLELRGKIDKIFTPVLGATGQALSSTSGEEIDALIALGYSLVQAREALNKVDKDIKDSGERIREALKNIGR